jgi:hypothetical protein
MATKRAAQPTSSTLSIQQARKVIKAALSSRQPLLVVGPPGIGKTTIVTEEARQVGLPVHVLIGALLDPVDVGGIPIVDRARRQVVRLPLGPVREVSTRPGVLFIDELNLASLGVQAAMLRGVLERIFGDVPLHKDSRVLLAANPPSQAAGSSEISGPLLNRLAAFNLRPTLAEVRSYFAGLGAPGTRLRNLADGLCLALGRAPALLQLDPPGGLAPAAWGSPRAWERGLRLIERLPGVSDTSGETSADGRRGVGGEDGEGLEEVGGDREVIRQALAGCVGEVPADMFLAQLRLGTTLPSVDMVLRHPDSVAMPIGSDQGAAALSILGEVAKADPEAGWIYAARLPDELRAAAFNIVRHRRLRRGGRGSRPALARKARAELAAHMGMEMAGVA